VPILGLFLLFLVLPVAELYVILKVGDSIGVWWTVLLLAADSLIGAMLLRNQGRAVWRRFNAAMSEGRLPHREVMDGVLVVFGGAFLITPGFITDVIGVLLLLPPSRAVIRRILARRLSRRAAEGVAGGRASRGPRRTHDVDGSATEYDSPPGRLER
jgi:UPF0716 protein FxsA